MTFNPKQLAKELAEDDAWKEAIAKIAQQAFNAGIERAAAIAESSGQNNLANKIKTAKQT